MNHYQNYSIDDIIFENRNKLYGAYQLRKEVSKNTFLGLLFTTLLISLLILLVSKINTNNSIIPIIEKVDASPSILDEVVYVRPTPPPKIKSLQQTTQASATVPTKAFTEIQATETPVITESAPKQEELLTAMVGTVNSTETSTTAVVTENTSTAIGTTTTANTTTIIPEKNKIEKWVEVMPSFVGGDKALMEYLQKNISMSSRDIENGISGKVTIQFYVDIDGSIRDAKVLKDGAGGSCAARALAVVKNMPKWNPGMQGKKAVRVYYSIPISFQVKN